jgi:DNA-binding NarL/FixJ family response regulator
VLIVDEHDGVRRGLTTALAIMDDLVVVGEASNGTAALQLCGQAQPDVVLMDIQLPDRNGIDIILDIRRQFPGIRIVILTTAPTVDLQRQAESAGASVYLQKYVAVNDLIDVIRRTHSEMSAASEPANTGMNLPGEAPSRSSGWPVVRDNAREEGTSDGYEFKALESYAGRVQPGRHRSPLSHGDTDRRPGRWRQL